MTTTIIPASGQGILYAQQGPGTTPGYSALDIRRALAGGIQEGVLGTSTLVTAGGVASVGQADFMVTQRNAGANMSVDVNMPAGGFAWVQGDTINGQGMYGVPVAAANINELVATADPTNPRLDQLILEIQDNVLDATGGNQARTRVLTGTPTAGATTTNRLGATALPGNALLLADWITGAGVTSITNANIRHRRKWACGALVRQIKTNGSPTTTAGGMGAIDTATLQVRVECSGVPLRITLQATGSNNTNGDGVATGCFMDGSSVDGVSELGGCMTYGAVGPENVGFVYTTIPTAGSHLFTPTFQVVIGGTGTLDATTSAPVSFLVEELVRQNTQNNVVTSG